MYCPLCGEKLKQLSDEKGPLYYECDFDTITWVAHGLEDLKKAPGDSWSLTYVK